jgi:hypothetical protein
MSHFMRYSASTKTALFGHLTAFKLKPDIKRRPTSRVLRSGIKHALERCTRVCKTKITHNPGPESLKGAVVSEIGRRDCYASENMMHGLGLKHVHLVVSRALDSIQPKYCPNEYIRSYNGLIRGILPHEMRIS